MNETNDDAIDALLRDQFDGPVPAGDFCERVMRRLPARRRPTPWPVAAGLVGGIVVCGLSLGAAPLARAGWRDWLAGDASAAALVLMALGCGLALLASVWSVSEVADRPDPPRRPVSPGA